MFQIDFRDTYNLLNILSEHFGVSSQSIEQYKKEYNELSYSEKPNKKFEDLNDYFQFSMPDYKIYDIKIAFYHVTTSNNECEEIKLRGLKDLQFAVSQDTNMRRFLKEHGVVIDIYHHTITYGDNNIINYVPDHIFYTKLENNSKPERHLVFKLYKDHIVWGFSDFKSLKGYSCIHEIPEFVNNIEEYLGVPNLKSDWIAEGHMPYLIKAEIPLSKLDINCIGGSEEYILQYLIESMISRLIDGSPAQQIIFLKEGEFISPDEIIEINNILPSEQ
ncbi:hypothetical protein [Cytobacillus praedii]|uniref:hypothetical protein n=1 Tax=Cytobacillus praedii TaxID=1742358 RepID=UPI002E1ADF56|nr:hypothetical protein [Cytobacillus praedii]